MYRVQIPVNAMAEAASFLIREWGDDRSISYTGHSFVAGERPERVRYFVFECGHADGSRWFIAASEYDATQHADDIPTLEAAVLAAAS